MAVQLTEEQKEYYVSNNTDLENYLISQNVQTRDESGNLTQAAKDFGETHYNDYGAKELGLGNPNRAGIEAPPPPQTLSLSDLSDEDIGRLNTALGPRTIEYSGGGSSTTNVYGDPVDYERIQGFVGTPEVRDEEGNIVTEATGIYAQPGGLMSGQQDLMTGQQTLGTGQGVLAEGQTTLGEGQTALAAGQQGIMGGQQALGEGQQAIGGAIGVASENQPQTLFGGQMALGQGQAGITSGVQGLGRDLTTLTGDLSDFESAQRQYQLAAEGQRAQGREIGMTTRDQLEDQLRTVGAQTNRMAEQQAQMRQQGMMAPQQAPQVQQASQAAQIAGQNLRSFAPQGGGMMGPTGPVAVDPRDQVGFGPTRSPV